MGAALMELISNIVDITGDPVADTIIFFIIGPISGSTAFFIIGFFSNLFNKYDSNGMSKGYWFFTVLFFIGLTYGFVKLAQLLRWIFSPPALWYLLGLIIFIVIIMIALFLIHKKTRRVEIIVPTENPSSADVVKANSTNKVVENEKFVCPLCGGHLKQKSGRFGSFIGCKNYPDCKYSRSK